MQIIQLQKALNKLGANPQLKLTGIFDTQTTAAIKQFQLQNQLQPVDGLIGPITGTKIAQKLNPNGIPVALAGILDCTDWDKPFGGWVMPTNCKNYRFFFQPIFPGGGYGAIAQNNTELSCNHIYVPVDPKVLQWVSDEATKIVKADPNGKYFALLIRGLTMGDIHLSPLETIQSILEKLGIQTQIVEEGLFAHENEGANQALAYTKASSGYKLMLFGHSMGADEIVPIVQSLNREFILNN